jgi:gamma-glutamylcyclotransferase (GGCT)/AIG2-like uncharacterized protein YtfP
MTDVFVYGTLTDPDRVASLLEEWSFEGEATLAGLHRVDGRYPTLAPGGSVDGRILRTDDVATLDEYEGVPSGLYVRIAVPRIPHATAGASSKPPADAGDSTREVAVYVGDPVRLGVRDDVTWPGTGEFEDRVRQFVERQPVGLEIIR